MIDVEPYAVEEIRRLLEDAIRRAQPRHEQWRALEALYRTGSVEQAQQAKAGTIDLYGMPLDQHVVNLVLPHLTVMRASIVSRDPKFVVEPIGGGLEAETHAKTVEGATHYFWKRTRATQDLSDATDDLLRLGNGFLKTGWVLEEEEVVRDAASVEAELRDRLEADAALADLDGGDVADVDDLAEQVALTETVALIDEPYVEYVSPYDIFVPTNARRMWETRWVAHRVTLPREEVEANPEYTIPEGGIAVDGDGASDTVANWKQRERDQDGAESTDTVTLYEFYDMRTRRLTVLHLTSGEPLVDAKPFYWSHRYPPFIHLRGYNPNGNEFWGFGDLENVAAIQSLFNEFVTEQVENARRSGTKWIVDERYMDDNLNDLVTTDEPDVVVPVNTGGAPIGDIIQAINRPGLSQDVYAAKVEFEEYMRKVLGISDFQAGGVGADRMSATAAAVVDGVSTLRAQDKIQSVEQAASQTALQLALLCQEFLDRPTAIRVAGLQGAVWIDVTREDLWGEFSVTVETGSTSAVNPATREQKAFQSVREIAPMLVELGYDPTPVVRKALMDLGYDPDVAMQQAAPPPQPEQPAVPAGAGAPADVAGPSDAVAAQLAGGLAL